MRFTIGTTWDGQPIGADEAATVDVEAAADGLVLRIDAPYHGDPPPPAPPGPTEGLWEHEVVEWFVAGPGDDAAVPYLEVEVGPHGHHLVLQLRGVRNAVARALPIDVTARIDGRRWSAVARIPAAWLPPRPWRANAYAIHGADEGRRYLAATPLRGARPDFHQPARFPAAGG